MMFECEVVGGTKRCDNLVGIEGVKFFWVEGCVVRNADGDICVVFGRVRD